MSKKEEITLEPDGEVSVELDGFEGAECFKHSAQVEEELENLGVRTQVRPEDIELKEDGDCEPDWERNSVDEEAAHE
ncbi:MAG: DUF2997 domain-containing protein [Candidatus Magasanikbacteria bacterium]